jgi:hypothetical protein
MATKRQDQLARRREAFNAYAKRPAETPVSATEQQAARIFALYQPEPDESRSTKPGGQRSKAKAKVAARQRRERKLI